MNRKININNPAKANMNTCYMCKPSFMFVCYFKGSYHLYFSKRVLTTYIISRITNIATQAKMWDLWFPSFARRLFFIQERPVGIVTEATLVVGSMVAILCNMAS